MSWGCTHIMSQPYPIIPPTWVILGIAGHDLRRKDRHMSVLVANVSRKYAHASPATQTPGGTFPSFLFDIMSMLDVDMRVACRGPRVVQVHSHW